MKIHAIGGYNEVGKNMTALEIGEDVLLFDCGIFLPAIIFLFRTNFFEVKHLLYSVAFLVLALFFRYADDWQTPLLSNGTHWLWHVSTSLGAIALANYLVKITPINLRLKSNARY